MSLALSYTIAQTHLMARKKQSMVAMLGVTFGISMFLVMISFMTGVNHFLNDLALDGSPHIRIYNPVKTERTPILETMKKQEGKSDEMVVVHHQRPKNELPKIYKGIQIAKIIEKMPEVYGVSPQVTTQVFYNNGPIQISGSISGSDILKENKLYKLNDKMTSGSIEGLLLNPEGIILGSGLAKKVNAKVGDRISITTPYGNTLLLKVVGTFSFGIATVDDIRSYASLATVQKILQRDPGYVTDIHLKMKDYTQAKAFGKELENMFGYKAEDWETANAAFFAGDQIRFVMTAVVSITLLIVAGFGIYNIMNMHIINKMKDIAILKATGFESKDIVTIFLLQSIIIGVLGGILGISIGYFFSYLISITPFPEGSILKIDTFPVNFDPMFYVLGVFFGFLTTLFAGYFPALKASKIDPVAILRG